MNIHDSSSRSSRLPEGFVFTGTLFALGQLAAQTPTAAPAEKKDEPKTENMGEMVVQGDFEKTLYKPERLQSPKMTQPLRDVAQTVTVIPSEVMKEQAASSLRDVLRNVPGIIVHGRYDLCTPVAIAWDLHKVWPEAELDIAADSGHAMSEPGIIDGLVRATEKFKHRPA